MENLLQNMNIASLDKSKIKKLMKNIQNNPKLFNLMKDMQKKFVNGDLNDPNDALNNNPKYKLKSKLAKMKMNRMTIVNREFDTEQHKNVPITPIIDNLHPQSLPTTIPNLHTIIKNEQHKKKQKIKRLQKKYGEITVEKWQESLTLINKYECNNDKLIDINHEKNICFLFMHQNQNIIEANLSLSSMSDDSDEI
jgi:hypothetical protein